MADLEGKRIDSTYIYVLNSDPNTAIVTNGDGSSVDWDGNQIVLKTGDQDISGIKNFDSIPQYQGLDIVYNSNTLSGLGQGVLQQAENSDGSVIFAGNISSLSGNYSVILAGTGQRLTGDASAIAVGLDNLLRGNRSFIGAGSGNNISGDNSFIGAGVSNLLTGSNSNIGAGEGNKITGKSSVVSAGKNNIISGDKSSISAGLSNVINSHESFIGAGTSNQVNSSAGGIIAGSSNEINGQKSAIAGGLNNRITGEFTAILGGDNNEASGSYGSILGGKENKINRYSTHASIVGGSGNKVSGSFSSSVGGEENTVSGEKSVIVGGSGNVLISEKSVIVGGEQNQVSGSSTSIINAGNLNIINESNRGFIGGGDSNSLKNSSAGSVSAGSFNAISGSDRSFIAGGTLNNVENSPRSIIGAGKSNKTDGAVESSVLAGNSNEILRAQNSSINAGSGNKLTDVTGSNILAGEGNQITGSKNSSILDGNLNNISGGENSSILGGQGNIVKDSKRSSVGAGTGNYISGDSSFIGAGSQNEVFKEQSAILAGKENKVSGDLSIIGGGFLNENFGNKGSILGGRNNLIGENTDSASILGGRGNDVKTGNQSALLGGRDNLISGDYSSLVGGSGNTLLGDGIVLLGGEGNTASGKFTTLFAGQNNNITGTASTVIAGRNNDMDNSDDCSIGAGSGNLLTGSNHSSIAAGVSNQLLSSDKSLVGVGSGNFISGSDSSALIAGDGNKIENSKSSIIGAGTGNLVENSNGSVLFGGNSNIMKGNRSVLVGGSGNKVFGDEVVLIGGKTNTASGQFVNLFAGENNNLTGTASTIVAGRLNDIDNSVDAAIVAGSDNDIFNSDDSSIIAGVNNEMLTSSGSSINAGDSNRVQNSVDSSVLAGEGIDIILSERSSVAAGSGNLVSNSIDSSISAGINNKIINSNFTHVGAGTGNQISGVTGSNISSADNSSIRINTDVTLFQKKRGGVGGDGIADILELTTYGYSSLFCKFPPRNDYEGTNISDLDTRTRVFLPNGINQNSFAVSPVHNWDGTELTINTGKFIESGFFQPPQQAAVINGIDNVVESDFSTIINGSGNILAGSNSIVAGIDNKASGHNSYIFGGSGNSIDVNLRIAHEILTGVGYEADTAVSNRTDSTFGNGEFSSGDFRYLAFPLDIGDPQKIHNGQLTATQRTDNPFDNYNTIINGKNNKIGSNKANDFYPFLKSDSTALEFLAIATESKHAHIIGGENNTIDGRNAHIINGKNCSIYPQKRNLFRTWFHGKPGVFGISSRPGSRMPSTISSMVPLEDSNSIQAVIPELSGLEITDFVVSNPSTSDMKMQVYESNCSIESSIRCEISGGFSNIERSLNCKILTPQTNSSMPENTDSFSEDSAASKYGFFNSIYNNIGSNISGSHHSSIFNGIGNQIRFDDNPTKDSDNRFLSRNSNCTILNGVRNVIEARDSLVVRQPYDTDNNNYSTILNGTENTVFGKFCTVANGTGNNVGGSGNFVFGQQNEILSGVPDNPNTFNAVLLDDRPASSSHIFGEGNVMLGCPFESVSRTAHNTIFGRRNLINKGLSNFIHGGTMNDPVGSRGTFFGTGRIGDPLVGQRYIDTENIVGFSNERTDVVDSHRSLFVDCSGLKRDIVLTGFTIQNVGTGMVGNALSFDGTYTGTADGDFYQHTEITGFRIKQTGTIFEGGSVCRDGVWVLCDDDPANTYSHNRIAWSGGSTFGFTHHDVEDFYKENIPYKVPWTGGTTILDGTITDSSSPRFINLQTQIFSEGFSGIDDSVITNVAIGEYTLVNSSEISQVTNASGRNITRSRIGLSNSVGNLQASRAILNGINRSEVTCFDESTLISIADSKIHGRINTVTPGPTRYFSYGHLLGTHNTLTGGLSVATVHGTGNTLVTEGVSDNVNIHVFGNSNVHSGDNDHNTIFGVRNTGIGFSYSKLYGSENHASGCIRTHIYGYRNTGVQSSSAFIFGEYNIVTGSEQFVFGEDNITSGQLNTLFYRNNIAKGTGNFAFSTNIPSDDLNVGNRMTGSANFCFGTDNEITSSRNIVFGKENRITGSYHNVIGNENNVSGDSHSISIIGNKNDITIEALNTNHRFEDRSFIFGSQIRATGNNMLAIGRNIDLPNSGAVINDSRHAGSTVYTTGKGPKSLLLDFENGTHMNLPLGTATNTTSDDGVPGSLMYSGEFLLVKTGDAQASAWGKIQISPLLA